MFAQQIKMQFTVEGLHSVLYLSWKYRLYIFLQRILNDVKTLDSINVENSFPFMIR